MNKYIILTNTIGTIGGEQIHDRNKYLYAERKGYKVYIISGHCNHVIIEELRKFKENVVGELHFYPTMFSLKSRKRVIDRILNIIEYKAGDNVIFESHVLSFACWAEILANVTKGKSFIHLLGERYDARSVKRLEGFLKFKYVRRELATIGRAEVMQNLFKPIYDIPLDKCFPLDAVAGNDAEDIDIPKRIDLGKPSDKVIGIAGRLEKSFVNTAIDEIIGLAENKSEVFFKIILIGYATDDCISKFLKKINHHKNIETVYTGEIYPIPRKLFQMCDMCISSSGTARIAGRYVLTVSMDAFTDKAIGILGYDTESALIGDNPNAKSLREYLELVLFTDFKNTADCNLLPPADPELMELRLKNHMDFINNSEQKKAYYDFSKDKRSIIDYISMCAYSFLGLKGLENLRDIKRGGESLSEEIDVLMIDNDNHIEHDNFSAAVSVICTTYNHEKYIADALQSFVEQKTNFKFEVVVCDDKSTDGTADIIRQFEKKHPSLIKPIYLEENLYSQGKSKLPYYEKKANGKYVAVCEGDDYWTDPYKLQKQYDYMETHPDCSWCIHNAFRVNRAKEIIGYIHPVHNDRTVTTDEVLLGGGGYCATNSIFVRSYLYFNRPSYFEILSLDAVMQAYFASRGRTYCMSDVMSAYRVGVEGSWSTRMDKNSEAHIQHLQKVTEVFNAYDLESNYRWHNAVEERKLDREFRMKCMQGNIGVFFERKYYVLQKSLSLKRRIGLFLKTIKLFLGKR